MNTEKRHEIKNISTIIVIVVAVLIIVFGFWHKGASKAQQTESNETSTSEVNQNSAPVITDEFADWVTFTDAGSGLTFLHPKNISVNRSDKNDFVNYQIITTKSASSTESRQEVTLKVYPYSEDRFAAMQKDLLKEVDQSDYSGTFHSESIVNQTFGIKGYQLNSEGGAPYFVSLFRLTDLIVSVKASGDSASLASDILSTINLNDKTTLD